MNPRIGAARTCAAPQAEEELGKFPLYLISWCALLGGAVATQAAVPTQFIAKMYSEALGRAPDPTGWNNALAYFEANGCNRQSLASWGGAVLSSAEFDALAYDSTATTLIMYRAILNREPDAGGYAHWLAALNDGVARQTVVAAFFGSQEFGRLIPYICNGASYSFGTLGTGLAIQIPTSSISGWGPLTEAQLQASLYSAVPGDTIYLRQESVVFVTQPLDIPAGVTLATYGLPGPERHALMARLVRASAFPGPMVRINADDNPNPAGTLMSLWIDGQRGANTPFVSLAIDIEIFGGADAAVEGSFITNSLGWTTLHSYGSLDGRPCAGHLIADNVVTAYASVHADGQWTDGLSIGCEESTVTNNQIIDPTDVGIVVYNAYPATQRSRVTDNTVVSAGNSAFGALVFDPLQARSSGAPNFTGAAISNNILWSGPNTHFIIGLGIGSRPWFGEGEIGRGAAAIGNSTAGIVTQFGAGVVVSGMDAAVVQDNVFSARPIPASVTNCPTGNVLASVSARLASGSIQSYSDVKVNGCMSDRSPVASLPARRLVDGGHRSVNFQ